MFSAGRITRTRDADSRPVMPPAALRLAYGIRRPRDGRRSRGCLRASETAGATGKNMPDGRSRRPNPPCPLPRAVSAVRTFSRHVWAMARDITRTGDALECCRCQAQAGPRNGDRGTVGGGDASAPSGCRCSSNLPGSRRVGATGGYVEYCSGDGVRRAKAPCSAPAGRPGPPAGKVRRTERHSHA